MTLLVQMPAQPMQPSWLGTGSMLRGTVGRFCNAELAAQPLRQFLKQKSLTSS